MLLADKGGSYNLFPGRGDSVMQTECHQLKCLKGKKGVEVVRCFIFSVWKVMIIKSVFNDVVYASIWIYTSKLRKQKKNPACVKIMVRRRKEGSSYNLIKITKRSKIDPFNF